jgi:hypothetical protein
MLLGRTLADDSGPANDRYARKMKNYRVAGTRDSHSRDVWRKNSINFITLSVLPEFPSQAVNMAGALGRNTALGRIAKSSAWPDTRQAQQGARARLCGAAGGIQKRKIASD